MKEVENENQVEDINIDDKVATDKKDSLAVFKALKKDKQSFLSYTSKKHDDVFGLQLALNGVLGYYQNIFESKNKAVNQADIDKRAKAKEMYDNIAPFAKALKDLNDVATSYEEFEDKYIQDSLDVITSFSEFLKGGEGQTNFEKLSTDIKYNKNISQRYKNAFRPGLKILDEAFDCGLNPENLDLVEAKEVEKKIDINSTSNLNNNINKINEPESNFKQSDAYLDALDSRYAIQWIDQLKDRYSKNPNSFNGPENFLKQIFAIRDLTEAERNEPSTLRRNFISKADIKSRIDTLMQNNHFRDFFAELNRDPKKMNEALGAATVTFGHGGKLEDMFKNYLKNLPAGQLEYDPAISRLMPTVKERIEGLQNQIKKGNKINDLDATSKAAAEILLLRNKIKCQRKEKSTLKVKCPCDDPTFNQNIDNLADQPDFRTILFNHDDIRNLITEGHGGEMIDEMRKAYTGGNISVTQILNEGTIDGRIEMLRGDIADMRTRIQEKRFGNKDKEETKKIVAEYTSLLSLKVKKKHKGEENVPRIDVNKFVDNAVNHDRNFAQIFCEDKAYDEVLKDTQNALSDGQFIKSFESRMNGAKEINDIRDKEALKVYGNGMDDMPKNVKDDDLKPIDENLVKDSVIKNGKFTKSGPKKK